MPPLKTYDLFISHAWKYTDEYYRLVNLLNRAPYFKWRNYSVPQHDPLTINSSRRLAAALDKQVRPANAVLVVSGMYVHYRDWIKFEVELAQHYNKPIIGIRPWGAQRIPKEVQDASTIMVGWNTDSIVKAIRKYSL